MLTMEGNFIGKLHSILNMKSIGLKVSRNTLYNYLEYMNDAYIASP